MLVDRLLGEYLLLWEERHGERRMDRLGGRHRSRMGDTLDAVGYEEALRRLRAFMADGDVWVVAHQHPLGYFLNRVNEYGRRARDGKVARHGEFDAGEENRRERDRRRKDAG